MRLDEGTLQLSLVISDLDRVQNLSEQIMFIVGRDTWTCGLCSRHSTERQHFRDYCHYAGTGADDSGNRVGQRYKRKWGWKG